MDHAQFLNVLSGKKCTYKNLAQIQDCIYASFHGFKGKKCALFFLNNRLQSAMAVETRAFSVITETWLLASIETKAKHQSMVKQLQTLEFCTIFTRLDYMFWSAII